MTRSPIALLALLLPIAACNPDEEVEAGGDIVDVAAGDERFETLVAAVQAAGLEDTLRSEGAFTVFAPTDEAFEAAGIDISALSAEELAAVLTYHVIAGAAVDSASVPDRAESVATWTLFFDTSDTWVGVNDATVTIPDIEADNGIIHGIDRVLMPPTILDAAGYAGLTSLAGAVGDADPAVATLLGGTDALTVFAPTNEAFAAISDTVATLDEAALTGVLSYHVLSGAVTSDAVPGAAGTLLTNEWGNAVTALFDTSDGVKVNGATVVAADIRATNGVIHVVDAVLLPPTVVDIATIGGFTGLLDAVGAASGDLGTTLSGEGPFTVFAPTNDAFDAIATAAASLTADELRDVLLFHVVGGEDPVKSTDLADGEVASLLSGASLTVDVGSEVMIEDAEVILADLHATNGIVHVIDAVMLPPAE